MTTQTKKENGTGKAVAIIGIPLAVILTWIFTAGQFTSGMELRVENNAKRIEEICQKQSIHSSKLSEQNTQLVRIETHYSHIKELLAEIRADIRLLETEKERDKINSYPRFDGIATIGYEAVNSDVL